MVADFIIYYFLHKKFRFRMDYGDRIILTVCSFSFDIILDFNFTFDSVNFSHFDISQLFE